MENCFYLTVSQDFDQVVTSHIKSTTPVLYTCEISEFKISEYLTFVARNTEDTFLNPCT